MANISLPDIIRRAARVVATEDDATTLDTVLSVGLTVFIAQAVVGIVTTLLPLVGGALALPITAGLVAVVANRLAE